MTYKHCCVVDAEGNYKTFVLVLVEPDQATGQDRETVQHYTLQLGERLIEAVPPALRPHAGAVGLVRPRWWWGGNTWTEGAAAAEIAAWEAEHPDPNAKTLEELRSDKLAELSAACNEVITSGFDIEFNGKAEHFNLSLADQNNIDSLSDLVKLGGTEFPYQADDGKCRIYTSNEIAQIYIKSKTTITTQTTYHNALKEYVQGLDDVEAIAAVQYGMELPEPFASEVADKLDRASAQMSTVLAAMGGDGGAV